jgi:hypothetical protein
METTRLLRHTVLAAMLATASAHADIYKSVDKEGRVVFSDVPLQGAVTIERLKSSGDAKAPSTEAGSSPQYLALLEGVDEMVRQANIKMDLAERALAQARRGIVESYDPLALAGGPSPSVDRNQIEFYKRDVATARRNLMRILQQRHAYPPRAVG